MYDETEKVWSEAEIKQMIDEDVTPYSQVAKLFMNTWDLPGFIGDQPLYLYAFDQQKPRYVVAAFVRICYQVYICTDGEEDYYEVAVYPLYLDLKERKGFDTLDACMPEECKKQWAIISGEETGGNLFDEGD